MRKASARSLPWRIVTAIAVASIAALTAAHAHEDERDARRDVPLSSIGGAQPNAASPPASAPTLESHPDLQQRYERARTLAEDRALDKALIELDALLADPAGRTYETLHLRAVVLARLGRAADALAAGDEAVRLRPDGVDAHFLLGGLRQREGDLDAAIEHFRAATLAADRELNNTKVTLSWLLLGQALAEAGYLSAAIESYERFDTAIWESHAEQRNAEEIQDFLEGRPYGALELRLDLLRKLERNDDRVRTTSEAIERWPDDEHIALLHASALLETGRAEQAAQFCRLRIGDRRASAALAPAMVDAARASGQIEDWVAELAQSIRSGQTAPAALDVVLRLIRKGDAATALALAEALGERESQRFDVVWALADARLATGDAPGALEALIEYVRRGPTGVPRLLPAMNGWMRDDSRAATLRAQFDAFRRRPDRDAATDYVLGLLAVADRQLVAADELLDSSRRARPDAPWAQIAPIESLLHRFEWSAARQAAEQLTAAQPELALAHYALGVACDGLDAGDAAEKALKTAIRLAPQDATLKLALAEHYRRVGELLSAQRFYQEALAVDASLGPAAEGLVESYLLDGKLELARKQFENLDATALSGDAIRRIGTAVRFAERPFRDAHLSELARQFDDQPDDVTTGKLLAAGLFVWGRLDEAEQVLERTIAAAPDDYSVRVLEANVLNRKGDVPGAIAALTRLSERYPNRREVLSLLTDALWSDFQVQPLRTALRRLVEIDPDNRAQHRVALLRSYDEFGEADEALKLLDEWSASAANEDEAEEIAARRIGVLLGARRYEEAWRFASERLDRDPTDLVRRRTYVLAGWEAGRFSELEARLREWLSAAPRDVDYMGLLVETLIRAKRPADALELARAFEGDWSGAKRRRVWIAQCLGETGDVDGALREYDAMLDERQLTEGDTREVRARVLELLTDARRIDDALARCDRWLADTPEGEVEHRYLLLTLKRRVLLAARRDVEYAALMESLLDLTPDDPGLKNDLGYTLVDNAREMDRATAMIRDAVRAEPTNPAYLDSLGWAYYKSGDFANARRWLERALMLRDGRDATIYDHAGDAAARAGDPDAAARLWREGLESLSADPNRQPTPDDDDVRKRLTEKLERLAAGGTPETAPTAAEQAPASQPVQP